MLTGKAENHPDWAAIHAAFPGVKLDGGGLSTMQGRVVFHQERLFRSIPAPRGAHDAYAAECRRYSLPVRIDHMTNAQCVIALKIMERVARRFKMHLFRQTETL